MIRYILFFWVAVTAILVFACEKNSVENRQYQVGIVSLNYQAEQVIEGFMRGMEKKGYADGQNISYIYPGPLDSIEQAKQLTRKLVEKKVDLIYTITTPATKAAQIITKGLDIPLLFGPMMSPVSAGLVTELYSSENSLTGVRVRGSAEKALFYLLEILPGVKNIYAPFHIGNGPAKVGMIDLKKAASKLGVKVLKVDVHNTEELINALNEIPDEAEAIWLGNSHMLVRNVSLMVETGIKRNIPVVSPLDQSRKGVLVTYAPKHKIIGEQLSRFADKLLRGIKTSSLPIETADFFLGLNAKTAGDLGVEFPSYILNQADFIVR